MRKLIAAFFTSLDGVIQAPGGLEGDVPQAVARLKEGDGPDLLTQGSSVLVQTLLAAGLVDELSLMTFPVLLGRGKRWYGEDAKAGEWEQLSSRSSTTGVTMSRY